MGIGQRIQVQLVQFVQGQSTTGVNTETEGDKFGVWAEIETSSGGRDYTNGQVQFDNTKRFLIRFRFDKYPGVNWKISYQGKNWTISQIQKVDEKRFYWSITTTAKNNV